MRSGKQFVAGAARTCKRRIPNRSTHTTAVVSAAPPPRHPATHTSAKSRLARSMMLLASACVCGSVYVCVCVCVCVCVRKAQWESVDRACECAMCVYVSKVC